MTQPWTSRLAEAIEGNARIEVLTEYVFSPGGPAERVGLRPRPVQRDLALAIARRADQGGWTMGEAPTGTGKSVAYLVPGILAVLRARHRHRPAPGKRDRKPRLVVSTANIALQDQVVRKDVPAVAAMLGLQVRVGLLKGRSNFVCLSKLSESSLLLRDRDRADIERLAKWVALHPDAAGDRDGLPFQLSPFAWAKCSTDNDGCPKDGCGHHAPSDGYDPCFAERSRADADEAEVLVVNHHYLAVAGAGLGPGAFLAVDEAHQLEEALRGAATREVRRSAVHTVARLVRPVYGAAGAQVVGPPVQAVLDAARDWLRRTGAGARGRRPLPRGWCPLPPSILDPLAQASAALGMLSHARGGTEEEQREAKRHGNAKEQIDALHERLLALMAACPTPDQARAHPGPWAMWAEVDGEGATLGYCPVDVAPGVATLQKVYRSGCLVSATLDPEATSIALGMVPVALVAADVPAPPSPAAEALRLPSPYDLPSLGVLVVPHGPGPKEPGWDAWASAQVVAAVAGSRGRALVLASSRRQCDAYADALRAASEGWVVHAQGDAGRGELRDRFRGETSSVLVGTRSFFEGLDVQGESCSLVVIDRIPFDAPGDPVEDAVGDLASRRGGGGSPFLLRSIPRAVALLAQASGRLIRSETDRGALVVLDKRVLEAGPIGLAARRALPPFPVSRDVGDVARHLAGEQIQRVALVEPAVNPGGASRSVPLRRGMRT